VRECRRRGDAPPDDGEAAMLGIPLLIIPFAVYNMLAFLLSLDWTTQTRSIQMVSGTSLALTYGEVLIVASIIFLYIEMLKATRVTSRTIVDHMLSTVLFIAILVEFLLVQKAATGTFFLLLVISFIDMIGGFTISIRSARREVTVEGVEKVAA
jgi:hypothetical protein